MIYGDRLTDVDLAGVSSDINGIRLLLRRTATAYLVGILGT